MLNSTFGVGGIRTQKVTTNDDFKLLCNKLNLKSSNIEEDSESKEYTGLSFESDNQKYKFRSAKSSFYSMFKSAISKTSVCLGGMTFEIPSSP